MAITVMRALKKISFVILAMFEPAELLLCMISSKITKRDSMFKLILGLGVCRSFGKNLKRQVWIPRTLFLTHSKMAMASVW